MKFDRILAPACFIPLAFLAAAGSYGAADQLALRDPPALAAHSSSASRDPLNAAFDKASAAQQAKDFDRALRLFQDAASLADRRSRPMSWLTSQFNICHTLNLKGEKNKAAAVARQIVRDCESSFGSGDPLTSEALTHLAFVLKQHGRLAEAEPVYRRNVRLLEEKYGHDHYLVSKAICSHGSLLLSLGRTAESEAQLRRALAIALDATDASGDPVDLCYFLTHLAYCLHATQQEKEARELMDAAYEIVKNEPDTSLTSGGSILRRQAEFYRDVQELDRAEELARRGLLRLARRHDVNRAKFFYYDLVAEVYRTVLRAKGMNDSQIAATIHAVEEGSAVTETTAAAE
ncbi:MAG TPA: tetratricopeptide repeat protein [Prosthecobacter sp.]|nr:tetratricopeptide repeat protein [Prosthecobacter sp.]